MNHLEVSKRNVTNGKAIASLILGIFSIVILITSFIFHFYIITRLVWFTILIPIIGLILGITGIMISIRKKKQLKNTGGKINIYGLICNLIAIVLQLFALLGVIQLLRLSAW